MPVTINTEEEERAERARVRQAQLEFLRANGGPTQLPPGPVLEGTLRYRSQWSEAQHVREMARPSGRGNWLKKRPKAKVGE